MNDLPKLPGGWVWYGLREYPGTTEWLAEATTENGDGGVWANADTRAEAIARVAAMVEAVVGSEVKRD